MNLNNINLQRRTRSSNLDVDPYEGNSILERLSDGKSFQLSTEAINILDIIVGEDYVGIEFNEGGEPINIHNFGSNLDNEFNFGEQTLTLKQLVNNPNGVVHRVRTTGRFASKNLYSNISDNIFEVSDVFDNENYISATLTLKQESQEENSEVVPLDEGIIHVEEVQSW